MKLKFFFTVFILGSAYSFHVKAVENKIVFDTLALPEKKKLQQIKSLAQAQTFVKLSQASSVKDKNPVSTRASSIKDKNSVSVKTLSVKDKSPVSVQASSMKDKNSVSAQASSMKDKNSVSAQASSMKDKNSVSAQASSMKDKNSVSAQASSMKDKNSVSAQASSMRDKNPVSAQASSMRDKNPVSAQASSVKDKNSVSAQASSMRDKNSVSVQAPSKEAKKPAQTDFIVSEKNKNLESAPKSLDSANNPKILVQNKIEDVLKEFLIILEVKPVQSTEYKNTVAFLEESLYDQVSFRSLKILSEVYEKKGDLKNHLKVIRYLSVNYPERAESFYLLGKAHKSLSETIENDKVFEDNQNKITGSYNRALKLDPKHIPSYNALLEELMESNPDYPESKKHTRASLNLVMEMLENLKDNKYYISLCEAYYDNKFIRQTHKACVKSMKRNPKDPISPLVLSLSLPNEAKRMEKLLLVADKHPDSFPVQYRVGLYFRKNSSGLAIAHLRKAHKLNPDHLRLNQILSGLLFRNNREEEALPHFLKSCLLTEGGYLTDFRKARGILSQKKQVDLVIKFNKEIKKCYQKVRQKNLG